jgi:hypothetical protein
MKSSTARWLGVSLALAAGAVADAIRSIVTRPRHIAVSQGTPIASGLRLWERT